MPLRGNSPCVAGKNDLNLIRACGRELCEAFSQIPGGEFPRPVFILCVTLGAECDIVC